jgi:5'-methylthioadenosine/S-adenosylhomocysteine nucleosidase
MYHVLFICALAEEQEALLRRLGNDFVIRPLSARIDQSVIFYESPSLTVYVAQSGMGNVNASINLTLFLERFALDLIVLLGVGGALHPSLKIGDMVLSDKVIQHDYFSSLASGNHLMRPGQLILSDDQVLSHNPLLISIPCKLNITDIKHPSIKVIVGLIASGSEFVATEKRKQAIHRSCQQALLVDMEASAIAVVANRYRVPFVVAKTVSDTVSSDGNISSDFTTFLPIASKNAAAIATVIIDNLNR